MQSPQEPTTPSAKPAPYKFNEDELAAVHTLIGQRNQVQASLQTLLNFFVKANKLDKICPSWNLREDGAGLDPNI
jgi:hypothetical protein